MGYRVYWKWKIQDKWYKQKPVYCYKKDAQEMARALKKVGGYSSKAKETKIVKTKEKCFKYPWQIKKKR